MTTQPNNERSEPRFQRPLHEHQKAAEERAANGKHDPIADLVKGIADGGPSLRERLISMKDKKPGDVKAEEVLGLLASIIAEGTKPRPGRDTDELTPERNSAISKLHKTLREQIGFAAIDHGPDKTFDVMVSTALCLVVRDMEGLHPGFTGRMIGNLKLSRAIDAELGGLLSALVGGDADAVEIDVRDLGNLFRRR